MKIAYVQYASLIDYPGKLSAVLWTVGCNLRCPFCYNAELVLPELQEGLAQVKPEEVLAILQERRGFLDGLVVTGGEPTLQPDLAGFLTEVKRLGFATKLDTNGILPDVLSSLLDRQLVDYVALDIKAPFDRYGQFTGFFDQAVGASHIVAAVKESIFVAQKAEDYEFRTTVAPGLSEDDLTEIAHLLSSSRVTRHPSRIQYVLQPFFAPKGKRLVDETWRDRPYLFAGELKKIAERLRQFVPCVVRA